MILYLKAFHIIGFVAWFAGLFYLVRMFVYHAEAMDKPEPERGIIVRQLTIMEWRVYKIICNPAMVITLGFGFAMLYLLYGMEWLWGSFWMTLKIILVILLMAYHFYCKRIIEKLELGEKVYTSFQFRLMNEIPTLFLISIVLLAVLKNSLNFLWAVLGVLGFGVLLYYAAKLYKQTRERRGN